MTIRVRVTNTEEDGPHLIQVHRVSLSEDGSMHIEDGVRLAPGESRSFYVGGTTKLAIEEVIESDVIPTSLVQDPPLAEYIKSAGYPEDNGKLKLSSEGGDDV